jgi:hypothetical protein
MGYPEVIHRQLWITFLSAALFRRAARQRAGSHAMRSPAYRPPPPRRAHSRRTVRRLRLSFCKRNCCYLVKTISATPDPGIELKCFLKLLVQCGGCMKRRSARQLVRLLSDIRHAAHCSTLRAAATNRAIVLASEESDADDADPDDSTEAAREARQDKPARSES